MISAVAVSRCGASVSEIVVGGEGYSAVRSIVGHCLSVVIYLQRRQALKEDSSCLWLSAVGG